MLRFIYYDNYSNFVHEMVELKKQASYIEFFHPVSEYELVEDAIKHQANFMLIPHRLLHIDVLQIVQELQKQLPSLKIIMLMSIKNTELIPHYLSYGVNEIIIRPITANKLLAKIMHIIDSHIGLPDETSSL